MYVELMGGSLDGTRYQLIGNSAPERIVRNNQKPFVYKSKLCAPLTLSRVVYVRSYCLNDTIYYVFHGHIE
jgi:hypothetical protein